MFKGTPCSSSVPEHGFFDAFDKQQVEKEVDDDDMPSLVSGAKVKCPSHYGSPSNAKSVLLNSSLRHHQMS